MASLKIDAQEGEVFLSIAKKFKNESSDAIIQLVPEEGELYIWLSIEETDDSFFKGVIDLEDAKYLHSFLTTFIKNNEST